MKVGILGSGSVAQTLGAGFRKHGHEVMLGTRTPSKLNEWTEQTPGAQAGTFEEAAAFGDALVLAVKGTAAAAVLEAAGAPRLAGKTILDATNPIADAAPEDGVLVYFTKPTESLMETLQRAYPEARFVKAFSSVGAGLMVNPSLSGGPPTMFICGNDEGSKQTVKGILDQFGWEAADMGTAVAARAIEPLAMLWCIPGFRDNAWAHAFKLLK